MFRNGIFYDDPTYGSPEDIVTYGYIQEIHCKRLSDEVGEFISSQKSLEQEIEEENKVKNDRAEKIKNHMELQKILNKNNSLFKPVPVKKKSNIDAIKAFTNALSGYT